MAQNLTEQFKAFVASKPADEKYDWASQTACALAQFGKPGLTLHMCDEQGVPEDVYWAAISRPSTFGALLERLNDLEARAA